MYTPLQRPRRWSSSCRLARGSLYQALRHRKYVGSLGQRLGYLPVSFNIDAASLDLDPRGLGGRSPHGAAAHRGAARALPAAAHLPLDDDDRRAAAGAPERAGRRRRLLLPVRPRLRRPPHARPGAAAAVPDDGDRDLAEPAARVPAPRRQDRGRQRPALGALVPALPAGPRRSSRRVLDDVDRFCVQSEESARRFIDLGADPTRVVVTGSLKFDSLDAAATAPQAARATACCATSASRRRGRCSWPAAR